MSASEQQLKAIAESPRFELPNFRHLHSYLELVDQTIMNILKTSSSWKGATADTAVDLLQQYVTYFRKIDDVATDYEASVRHANTAIDNAAAAIGHLPSTVVPPEIAEAAGTTVPFQGVDIPVLGAVGFVAGLLSDNREKAATDALHELQRNLEAPRSQIVRMQDQWPTPPVAHNPAPARSGDDTTGVPSHSTPTGAGVAPVWTGYPKPPGATDPGPGGGGGGGGGTSKDGDLDPHNPGGGGGGTTTPTKLPPKVPGSGLVPGLGGAGAAAGLAAAARVGGVGAGGVGGAGAAAGGAARLGSGLSGSAAAGTGAGGASGAGGAGGRAGATNMMGGGGGAGGAGKDKEKRSGLGGLIAPKLEDDEELGPRSAAADAGGRE